MRLFASLILIFLCLFGLADAAESLVLVTEDAPPGVIVDSDTGEVTGMITELVRKMLDESGIGYSISAYPWARAYALAQANPNTCVYSTAWTAERDPLFKWVGPLLQDSWALYGRWDSGKLSSLEDARGSTIGGYFGDASTNYLKQLGFHVAEVSDNYLNIKKLTAHRIDYWVNGLMAGNYLVHQAGYRGVLPLLKFKDVHLGLACNKSVPDETVGKLNKIIQRMNEDGTAAAIRSKYE